MAAASWNRAAGWANAEAVVQDLDDEMRDLNGRGLECALIQEAAPPFERGAEPPATPAWCWVGKEMAPADTAIAMRRRWEHNIVDIKYNEKWVALLLATQSDGHIALVSAHMPKIWDTEERWITTLASLGNVLRQWGAANRLREVCVGAD